MNRTHIPRQMMTYRPKGKRSLGRPLKRWRETVTGYAMYFRPLPRQRDVTLVLFFPLAMIREIFNI
jgi:hypothetical protein